MASFPLLHVLHELRDLCSILHILGIKRGRNRFRPPKMTQSSQMFSVETGQMSAVETGQMSAAETGQMSSAETRQM